VYDLSAPLNPPMVPAKKAANNTQRQSDFMR
jgi:hypothetical protein